LSNCAKRTNAAIGFLDILGVRDEGSVVLKNRRDGSDVRGGLEIEGSLMGGFENDLKGLRRLCGRGSKDAWVSLLNDALVGLEVVDATIEVPR
jgi:hypothetical protein